MFNKIKSSGRTFIVICIGIISAVLAIILLIFNRDFYVLNSISYILLTLLGSGFLMFLVYTFIAVALDVIVSKGNLSEMAFCLTLAVFAVMAYKLCQPINYADQYYVNVYEDYSEGDCSLGYVSMTHTSDGFSFDELYLANSYNSFDETGVELVTFDILNEIDLTEHTCYTVYDSADNEYLIEFIKEKSE